MGLVTYFGLVAANMAQAEGYGVFEPEAMAMGGAAVAIASPGNAVFYNPARLAQYRYDEDRGRHGRLYFPSFSAQSSQSVEDLYNIDEDQIVDELTAAVDQYNAQQDAASAGQVVDASREVLQTLTNIQGETLYGNTYAGLVVAEPGDGQGGAFFIAGRGFGDGDLTGIADADLALMQDYIDGLDFIASAGQRGEEHPELFGPDGLIDPRNQIVSTASAAAAAGIELGVAMAQSFNIRDQNIAFGITPKLMLLKTFDAELNISQNSIDTTQSEKWTRRLNADIGVAANIGNFNMGLAVKDVFRHNIETTQGQAIIIEPKPRLGLGYIGQRFKVGVDYDMAAIKPVATGMESQDVSVGVEWRALRQIALRFGYKEDLQGNHGTALSAGVGVSLGRFLMDLSYVESDDELAAALQFGLKI
ncbi:conjugal transfer protein TraF [Halioxenophilus aromaticivorans]|uniref:Conjugal transfer protein TraF n=1 Tax=Halioxenophilus aromaticivorans TaxID=1306992 RepID=A0AAV3U9M5_9ALTE